MNANPLRTGFVMEQVLGHVSHYQTLRNVVDGDASIHPYWVEVTYAGNGRLERLPRVPRGISGTLRGFSSTPRSRRCSSGTCWRARPRC